MKKLLLTIFAITALVACDKDAYDQDVVNINVVEQAEEINASIDIDYDIDGLIDRLLDLDLNSKSISGKGSASTARTVNADVACAADARSLSGYTNYLSYEIFSRGSSNFGLIRSEGNLPVAAFSPILTIWLAHSSGDNFDVVVNGNVVSSGTSAGLIGLFAVPNLVSVENLNDRFIYTGAGTTAAAGLDCLNASDYYDVQPAPFPLNGFLATINAALPAGKTSANYAGTTMEAVINAINADIVD